MSLSRLHEAESSDPTNAPLVVIVSSMYLDESDTLAMFEKILTKYAQLSPSPLFLLCGDFVSPSFSFDSFGLTRLERLFSSLAALLASFPQLVQQSQFVFVPGPRDIGCNGLFPREPVCLSSRFSVDSSALRSIDPLCVQRASQEPGVHQQSEQDSSGEQGDLHLSRRLESPHTRVD